jgi:hypothetical protein
MSAKGNKTKPINKPIMVRPSILADWLRLIGCWLKLGWAEVEEVLVSVC